jgi:molecular chaperone DnaK
MPPGLPGPAQPGAHAPGAYSAVSPPGAYGSVPPAAFNPQQFNPQQFGAPPPHAGGHGGYTMPPGIGLGPGVTPPVLVDVTPRALVVEVVGGFCDTIIPRNAKIPCDRRRVFTTGSDYQSIVRVRVAQGESPGFLQNTYLGEVELSGLRAAVRGEVQIGVTFELDADGSLRIQAQDVQTGQQATVVLQLVAVATDEHSLIASIQRVNSHPLGQA